MHQEEFWRGSRSFLERSRISWISTRTWSSWRSLYPDGHGRAERFQLSNDARRVLSIQKELVDLSQLIWKNRTGERSFWLQRCVDHTKPSTPKIWRTTTQTSSILEIPAMALIIEFFLQLAAMERFLVELMTINKKVHNWAHVQSDMIERRNPLCAVFSQNLRRVDFQEFLFFRFVAVRSFTADSGLLQPAGCVNTTPHTSIFSLWIYSSSVSLQGILVQIKSEKVWCIDNKWIGISEHTERQAQQCVKLPETLGNLWA